MAIARLRVVQIVLVMSVGIFFLNHGLSNWLPEILRAKGRRMQAWSEVMAGGELPQDVIVHQWIDADAGVVG